MSNMKEIGEKKENNFVLLDKVLWYLRLGESVWWSEVNCIYGYVIFYVFIWMKMLVRGFHPTHVVRMLEEWSNQSRAS
jgi:hypothetical protein